MVTGAAGPLGLVEETYAAAEYDFAGRTCFNHSEAGVAVEDGYTGAGTTIRAGRFRFFISHNSVLACLGALLNALLEFIKLFAFNISYVNPYLICPMCCCFLRDQAGAPESLPT